MDYEDRITVATPEGVHVELGLAGLGSRMLAAMIDLALQGAVLVAVSAAGAFLAGSVGPGVVIGVLVPMSVVILIGYPVVFELAWSGRTPGKRAAGIRVVRAGGYPVTATSSLIRNLIRLVDGPPFFYAIGVIAILASSKNQRLGDIAAATLVVRDRVPTPQAASTVEVDPQRYAGWDVTGVGADDLALVRRFVERRDVLTQDARRRLAEDLAGRLRAKVVGAHGEPDGESFLLTLLAAKAAGGRT